MRGKKVSILIAGGGTGGHLFPGISLAKNIEKIYSNCDITFFTTSKLIDKKIMSYTKYRNCINPMQAFPSSLSRILNFFLTFFQSWYKTIILFRKIKPDLIIGLGGYGAFSSCLLANKFGIPFVLLESNATPGKVVRWFKKLANTVYVTDLINDLNGENIKKLGLPIRFGHISKKEVSRENEKVTILVMGGSLGARVINQTICNSLGYLKNIKKKLRFIHIAGNRVKEIKDYYNKNGIDSQVFEFCNDMLKIYKKCDLVICRAGGGTLAEITAIGIPSILIPIEYSSDNHQKKNAFSIAKSGAGIVIEEKNLNSQILADSIVNLLKKEKKLEYMTQKAKSIGKPNAANDIASDIVKRILLKKVLERNSINNF